MKEINYNHPMAQFAKKMAGIFCSDKKDGQNGN